MSGQLVRFEDGSQEVRSASSWYPDHSTRYWIFSRHFLESSILETSHSKWSWMMTGSDGGWDLPGKGDFAGDRRETWKTGWMGDHDSGSLRRKAFFKTIASILKGPNPFSDHFLVGRVVRIFEESSQTESPTSKGGGSSRSKSALIFYLALAASRLVLRSCWTEVIVES